MNDSYLHCPVFQCMVILGYWFLFIPKRYLAMSGDSFLFSQLVRVLLASYRKKSGMLQSILNAQARPHSKELLQSKVSSADFDEPCSRDRKRRDKKNTR